jgi:uncharacterized integral membrane protein
LAIVAAAAVVLFAVSNRTPVTLELWPLPYRIETGMYAVVLVALLIGFIVGTFAAWLAGAGQRRDLRAATKRARDLELSLARLKDEAAAARAKAEIADRAHAA